MKKKLLSWFLAISMVFSLVQIPINAALIGDEKHQLIWWLWKEVVQVVITHLM